MGYAPYFVIRTRLDLLSIPQSGGKNVKTFIIGGIIGCKYKTSSWHLNRFPAADNIGVNSIICLSSLLIYDLSLLYSSKEQIVEVHRDTGRWVRIHLVEHDLWRKRCHLFSLSKHCSKLPEQSTFYFSFHSQNETELPLKPDSSTTLLA